MTTLGGNDAREFTVTRTPDQESGGYPFMCSVTLDGHTVERVTMSGLQSMKREINRAMREAKEAK